MIIKLIKSDKYEGVYYNPKESAWQAICPPLEEAFYYPDDDCYYVPDFIFEDGDLE